jgi:hypothetical protein
MLTPPGCSLTSFDDLIGVVTPVERTTMTQHSGMIPMMNKVCCQIAAAALHSLGASIRYCQQLWG